MLEHNYYNVFEKFPIRHWRRHTAAVPKGFLRYFVLKLLSLKPMSGVELLEEIGKRTYGKWKPSPGSIYPLLAWLQENGIIEGVPTEEVGIKRYRLTEKGKKLLEKESAIKEELRTKLKFIIPSLTSCSLWTTSHKFEHLVEFEEIEKRFLLALFELTENLESKFSKEIVEEIKKVLYEALQKIEEINAKLKEV
ncbi:MAG: PadR family transcriptional regulator [Candidatus Bathyarchaeia archaeon]